MSTLIITQRVTRKPVVPGDPGLLRRAPFVAIDLETTGASYQLHKIVEIGAVKMDHTGAVLDSFSEITNPGHDVPLTRSSQRIHGISPHQIRSARPLRTVLADLVKFVGPHGIVAHNLNFENRFLSAAFAHTDLPLPHWQGVCTLSAARKHLKAQKNSLSYLIDLLGISAVNDHRAATDAHACGMLLATLITKHEVCDLEPLITQSEPRDDDHAAAIAQFQTHLGATVLDTSVPQPRVTAAVDYAAAPKPTRTGPSPLSSDTTRQAFGGFDPTDEQRAVVDAFQAGKSVRVVAVAGSGKTSTVLGLARLEEQRDPHAAGLYLAFNASVAEEARRRAPASLKPMTAHALARKYIQKTPHAALLGKLGDSSPAWRDTAAAIGSTKIVVQVFDGRKMFNAYTIGRYALKTVEEFCKTMDSVITTDHVPSIKGVSDRSPAYQQLATHIVPIARRAWANILDPAGSAVRFNHNHYLKLWAMTGPKLRDVNYAILDEAQDANPVIAAIVAGQDHLRRVVIGDPSQAIYRFTGAVDALSKFPVDVDTTLTQSWRFGDAIAEAGNTYLRQLNSPVLVRGNPAINDDVHFDARDYDAVLARTNGDALSEVMAAQKAGRRVALIGNTEQAVKFCDTARSLQMGAQPNDPEFAAFDDWSQLLEYIENTPNTSDVATMVRLVDEHGIDRVEQALKGLVTVKRAETVLSTVHRAKGLEFDRVRIHSGFTVDSDDSSDPADLEDERRLAYVALTRAQRQLNPGQLLGRPKEAGSATTAAALDVPPGMLL